MSKQKLTKGEALKDLAREVRQVVKNQPVKIGQIAPYGEGEHNFGPGLEKMLATELTALDPKAIADNALYQVVGRYGLFSAGKKKFVRIKIQVTDVNSGETIKDSESRAIELNGTVEGPDIFKVGGNTGELPTDPKEPFAPGLFVKGSKIKVKENGLLTVEIRARANKDSDARALDATEGEGKKKGQAFVEVPKDYLYEVALTNHAKFDAGVTLTIDGLDVFEFSLDRGAKGRPKHKHFIIPAGKTGLIKGWFLTADPEKKEYKEKRNILSFVVTEYGKGASSKKNVARDKVGVLTVTYAAAWDKDENKPDDEPKVGKRSGNETGFGPPQGQQFKEVVMQVGVVREVVSVRYTR